MANSNPRSRFGVSQVVAQAEPIAPCVLMKNGTRTNSRCPSAVMARTNGASAQAGAPPAPRARCDRYVATRRRGRRCRSGGKRRGHRAQVEVGRGSRNRFQSGDEHAMAGDSLAPEATAHSNHESFGERAATAPMTTMAGAPKPHVRIQGDPPTVAISCGVRWWWPIESRRPACPGASRGLQAARDCLQVLHAHVHAERGAEAAIILPVNRRIGLFGSSCR